MGQRTERNSSPYADDRVLGGGPARVPVRHRQRGDSVGVMLGLV